MQVLRPPVPKVLMDGFTITLALFQGSMLLEVAVHMDDEGPDLDKPIAFIECTVILKM